MSRQTSVALRYDRRLPAPLVVARGKGDLADRLVSLAREHGVPIVESQGLAESLYVTDPGELVPERFYQAVAEILGFVWRSSTAPTGEDKKVWDENHQGQ